MVARRDESGSKISTLNLGPIEGGTPAMTAGASIILGTAQFGMPYGVANRTGQLDRAQAEATIRIARSGGIRLLDTAVGYGQSEDRDGVQRLAGRHHATHADQALRRLEPDDVVERRGHAPRARRVGTEREGHEARRNRHRRP